MDGGDQHLATGQRPVGFQGFHHFRQLVVAAVQQVKQGGFDGQLTLRQALIKGFQLVAQVAQLRHFRHACATLEGVQIPLQGLQLNQVVLLADPQFQAVAGGFKNFVRFFQEDFYQFRVALRLRGRLGGLGRVLNRNGRGGVSSVGGGHHRAIGRFTLSGIRERWSAVVVRGRGGNCPRGLATDEGLNGRHQGRRIRRGDIGLQVFDHHRQAVMALMQQLEQGSIRLQLAGVVAFVQVFQFVGQVADGGNTGHAGTALERVQVSLQAAYVTAVAGFPLVENVAGRFENFLGFFQEQFHQLRVQVRFVAAAVRGLCGELANRG